MIKLDCRRVLRTVLPLMAICCLAAAPLLADNFDDHRKLMEQELPPSGEPKRARKFAEAPLVQKEFQVQKATRDIGMPRWGYTNVNGSFEVRTPQFPEDMARGLYRTMRYPLGIVCFISTSLKYEQSGYLNGHDGWLFKTGKDGKEFASFLFFSDDRESPDNLAYRVYAFRDTPGWTDAGLHMRTEYCPQLPQKK
jgi:hypothetical protein